MEQISNASFSLANSSGRGKLWLTLEQEFKGDDPSENADFSTLEKMLNKAYSGLSAFSTLALDCKYANVVNNVVTIRLVFYVWPSNLDLEYSLTINEGTISGQTRLSLHKSFDIIIEGSSYEDLPFIFDGTYQPQMPVFTPLGERLDRVEWSTEDSTVSTDQAVTTVLRANGFAKGYKHTAVATFTKEGLEGTQKVEDVKLQITATWLDEEGETQTAILPLEIPDCAIKQLEFCENDSSFGETTCGKGKCNGEDIREVFFSTCEDDTVLDERWVRTE